MPTEYLSFKDAAKLIGCNPSRLRQMRLAGKIVGARQIQGGRGYELPRKEALRIKAAETSQGWRRGEKRRKK